MQVLSYALWYAGWLALTKGLFRKGDDVTLAFQHLQKGLQEGWNPDASLFEYVIQAFCKADNMEQAQRVLTSMPDLGCPPRTTHINLLVELVAHLQGAWLPTPVTEICSSSCVDGLFS